MTAWLKRAWQWITEPPADFYVPGWHHYEMNGKATMNNNLTITKEYRFESSHILPWHEGKCGRQHGHSYILQVEVAGPVKPDDGEPDSGMVMDFADISAVMKPLIAGYLDHYQLNDSLMIVNPTAERIVQWIAEQIRHDLPGLASLRLYETATGWVTWTPEN